MNAKSVISAVRPLKTPPSLLFSRLHLLILFTYFCHQFLFVLSSALRRRFLTHFSGFIQFHHSIPPPFPPSPTPPRPHFLSARSQSSFSSSAWLSAIISSTPYNVLPSRLPISQSPLHILFIIIHPPFLFFLAGLFFVFHLFLHLLFPLLFPYTERLHRQCFRYNPKRRRVLRSWPRILDVAYIIANGSNGDQTSNFDFLTHFTNVKMSKQVEALAVALAYTRQKCLWTRETEPTFLKY